MEELCNGFRLLMDPRRGLITFESLKRNAALLGLGGLGDDELRAMLREGDVDDDGSLSEREFCVLMIRLSPELMDGPADGCMTSCRTPLAEYFEPRPPSAFLVVLDSVTLFFFFFGVLG